MIEHGEVWLANLNPRRGTEPGKTRPVLIVQAQALNDAGHPSTLIVPLTTNLIDEAEPLRIRVPAQSSLCVSDSDLAHRPTARDRQPPPPPGPAYRGSTKLTMDARRHRAARSARPRLNLAGSFESFSRIPTHNNRALLATIRRHASQLP